MTGAASAGEKGASSPSIPPLLRLVTSDVLTEACCLLDAKSLATGATVCRAMKEVCQGFYPWRLLCCREWGLLEEGEKGQGSPNEVGFFGVRVRSVYVSLVSRPM